MVLCWQCCVGAALLKFVPSTYLQPCDVVALFYQFLVPPALVTTGVHLKVGRARLTNSPLRHAAAEELL